MSSALQAVVEHGLCDEARQHASAALLALSDKQMTHSEDSRKHVMLSYQWTYQATLQRTNESLIARGYATWFDLTHMKGVRFCSLQSSCSVLLDAAFASVCARVFSRSEASTRMCVCLTHYLDVHSANLCEQAAQWTL